MICTLVNFSVDIKKINVTYIVKNVSVFVEYVKAVPVIVILAHLSVPSSPALKSSLPSMIKKKSKTSENQRKDLI